MREGVLRFSKRGEEHKHHRFQLALRSCWSPNLGHLDAIASMLIPFFFLTAGALRWPPRKTHSSAFPRREGGWTRATNFPGDRASWSRLRIQR